MFVQARKTSVVQADSKVHFRVSVKPEKARDTSLDGMDHPEHP